MLNSDNLIPAPDTMINDPNYSASPQEASKMIDSTPNQDSGNAEKGPVDRPSSRIDDSKDKQDTLQKSEVERTKVNTARPVVDYHQKQSHEKNRDAQMAE